MNKEIIETIKNAKTVAELKEVASKNGYSLTDKEADGYFSMYHNEGQIGDNDLDNVVGGACTKFCNFKAYGGDNNLLMVAQSNSCEGFDAAFEGNSENCLNCKHVTSPNGGVFYCSMRTYDDDPYNNMIGTTKQHLGNNRYW